MTKTSRSTTQHPHQQPNETRLAGASVGPDSPLSKALHGFAEAMRKLPHEQQQHLAAQIKILLGKEHVS